MQVPFTIMNKCKKIEISVLKTPFFGPQKVRFWFLKKKKNQKIFSSCFCSDSALKTIDAPMFLIGILENALKNIEQNNIYALKKLKKWKKL